MQQDKLEKLLAKQEITEILFRFMRGIDRLDKDLITSCFHPGATVDFGRLFNGTVVEMIDWIWGNHQHTRYSCHQATNVLIEVDGDYAFSECYLITSLRLDMTAPVPGTMATQARANDENLRDVFFLNRYIDHWSRRGEKWAIDRQVQVEEFSHPFAVVPGPFADAPANSRSHFDKSDAYYVEREAWKKKLPHR